jgi:trehalose synthase
MVKDSRLTLCEIEDYRKIIGDVRTERIIEKAKPLKNLFVSHCNSTLYGGGVAEILDPLTLLSNNLGIKTEWRVIHGTPDFFSVTKKFHNALQGDRSLHLTDLKKEIYEWVMKKNSIRNRTDHDFMVIHDPQPLALIDNYDKKHPWIWQCHADMSDPNKDLLSYLKRFIDQYDVVVLTLEEYRQDFLPPQVFFTPGIDPLSTKNKFLNSSDVNERLDHYSIPYDKPIITQISRFDHAKDPEGVIKIFKKVRDSIDCRLVLLGNVATDDPEGEKIYQKLLSEQTDNIRVLSVQDSALVNALQRKAAVVVQKSLKEGFGLTVTEAMWKEAAVVGGNVGGIKHQIEDGKNGFLVSSTDEAVEKIVKLLIDPDLRKGFGKKAKRKVKDNYLLTCYLEKYLDLFNSFETVYRFDYKQFKTGH